MEAKALYKQLDADFELDKRVEDTWDAFDLGTFVTDSFDKTRKGLVLDNTKTIAKAYTAVFPSEKVIKHILDSGEHDILLFTHHPMIWDTTLEGPPFRNIPHHLLGPLQEQGVSYYAIHVPLDAVGPYSTSVSLARAIGVTPRRYFFEYFGVDVGVVGNTDKTKLGGLAAVVKNAVDHEVKVWDYGVQTIKDSQIAIVAGGGGEPEIANDLVDMGINTYVTGVTRMVESYPPTIQFHEICRDNDINVISATHYSTEKFACIAIVDYFENLGVPCEFIEDEPTLSDME